MEQFVLSDYVDMAEPIDLLQMESLVFEDGDSVILLPSGDLAGVAYRLPKESVLIGELGDLADTVVNGVLTTIPMYEVSIDASANCAQMTVDQVSQFLGLTAAEQLAIRSSQVASANLKLDKTGMGELRYGSTAAPCRANPNFAYPAEVSIGPADKYRRRQHRVTGEWMEYGVLLLGAPSIYLHSGPMTLEQRSVILSDSIYLPLGDAVKFYEWLTRPTILKIEK